MGALLRISVFFVLCVFLSASALYVYGAVSAATLLRVSDRISMSAPNATSTHLIQFTPYAAIPASGYITITPEAGDFTIPALFDYTEVDVAVSTGGPYTDRTIAATQDATNDGVSVVTGTSGSITIRLNSTSGIAAGSNVRIALGTNAVVDALGTELISNPSSPGSYKVAIATADASNVRLDIAQAMIAVVAPVTVTLQNLNVAPGRFNALPSGVLAAGNGNIELSLETDEVATCKYATVPGVDYSAMPYSFTSVNGILFYTVATGHQNNTSYTYYVRCTDLSNLSNTDDYELTFSLDETPISNTSIIQTGASGQGGTGPYQNGSAVLYMASVRLTGWTSPGSRVFYLKDGVLQQSSVARSDGFFDSTLSAIERGTYSFAVYSLDSTSARTPSYASTLSLNSASNNSISDIVLPPTLRLESSTIEAGEDAVVLGEAVPGGVIEVRLRPSVSASVFDVKTFTASSSKGVLGTPDGQWSVRIPASALSRGTYLVSARVVRSVQSASEYTRSISLGVGESAPESDIDGLRGDFNRDGKVNLIDFSILLSSWGTDNERTDLSGDGIVNLADFSILLFNWTG